MSSPPKRRSVPDWLHPRRTQTVDDWEREEVYGGDPELLDAWYQACEFCDEEFTSDLWVVVAGRVLGHVLWQHADELEAEFRRRNR